MNYNTASQRAAGSIRALLAERGESVISLAEATDIPLSNLNRRLRGLQPFTVEETELIANHLGVSVGALLTPPSERYAIAQ